MREVRELAAMAAHFLVEWELCSQFLVCPQLAADHAEELAWYEALPPAVRKQADREGIPPLLAVLPQVFAAQDAEVTAGLIGALPRVSRAVYLSRIAAEQRQMMDWQRAAADTDLVLPAQIVDPAYICNKRLVLWSLALRSALQAAGES